MEFKNLTIKIDNEKFYFEEVIVVPHLKFISEPNVNALTIKLKDVEIYFDNATCEYENETYNVSEYDYNVIKKLKKYFKENYEIDLICDYEEGGQFEEFEEDDNI